MDKKRLLIVLSAGILCVTTNTAGAGSLVGYRPFDGNLNDPAGTSNGAFSGGRAADAAGWIGQAVSFEGMDDFAYIPSRTSPAACAIGVRDRTGPKAGGAGRICIDDIRPAK